MIHKIFNHGEIELIDVLGSDLTVVNSARVSFGNRKTELDEGDIKLIKFLAKNKHYSPFRHSVLQFRIKIPEFIARQWYKHVVGIETTSTHATKDHAWNEISQRYVELKDEFFKPSEWRAQSKNNKQASEGLIEKQDEANRLYDDLMNEMFSTYKKLLEIGVAKEQARMILPLSIYTEFYWTASFQAVYNFLSLRKKPDAQGEINDCAEIMYKIIDEDGRFKYSLEAFGIS
jgi:thymidylate synthase (FAD)